MQCSDKIILFGYVGGAPKMPTPSNPNFVIFNVGVQKYSKDNDVSKNKTTWYKCLSNEKWAEKAKRLTSGTKIYVEGIPKLETYQDQAKIGVNITYMKLLHEKKDEVDDKDQSHEQNVQSTSNDVLDDEIPF